MAIMAEFELDSQRLRDLKENIDEVIHGEQQTEGEFEKFVEHLVFQLVDEIDLD